MRPRMLGLVLVLTALAAADNAPVENDPAAPPPPLQIADESTVVDLPAPANISDPPTGPEPTANPETSAEPDPVAAQPAQEKREPATASEPPTLVENPADGVYRGDTANTMQSMVTVRRNMPDRVEANTPFDVEIFVVNKGKSPLERVVVSDQLTPGVRVLGSEPPYQHRDGMLFWELSDLQAGQQRLIKLTVEVPPEIDTPRIQSTLKVHHATAVRQGLRVLKPKLQVSLAGPKMSIVQEPMQYRVTVTNVGTLPARDISLKNILPEGMRLAEGSAVEEIGTLDVAQTRRLKLTLVGTRPGSFESRCVVAAQGMDPVEAVSPLKVHEIKVALEGHGPRSRFLHHPCTYEFNVTNAGTMSAKGAKLVTQIPAGVIFAYASDDGVHDGSNRQVVWELGDLPPGQTRRVALTAVASEVGDQVCKATVTAGGNVKQETECLTTVQGVAALLVEVVDIDDPIEVGMETVYEIHVGNQGSTPLTNVKVRGTIPPSLQAIAADGPTEQKMAGEVLSFDPLPELKPKTKEIYRVKVRGTKVGEFRFRTEVHADQINAPVLEEESTTVYQAPQ